MERTVVSAAADGLPVAIVNPAACLGPWEFRDEDSSFVRLALARRLPAVIDQTICVIDVRDVYKTYVMGRMHVPALRGVSLEVGAEQPGQPPRLSVIGGGVRPGVARMQQFRRHARTRLRHG